MGDAFRMLTLSISEMSPNFHLITPFISVIHNSLRVHSWNLFILSAHTVSRSNGFCTFTTYSVKYYFLLFGLKLSSSLALLSRAG